MTDTATKQRLIVNGPENDNPFLYLPDARVPEVQRILDAAGVRFEVADFVIEYDNGPAVVLIIFRRGTDGHAVQKLLDAAD